MEVDELFFHFFEARLWGKHGLRISDARAFRSQVMFVAGSPRAPAVRPQARAGTGTRELAVRPVFGLTRWCGDPRV